MLSVGGCLLVISDGTTIKTLLDFIPKIIIVSLDISYYVSPISSLIRYQMHLFKRFLSFF